MLNKHGINSSKQFISHSYNSFHIGLSSFSKSKIELPRFALEPYNIHSHKVCCSSKMPSTFLRNAKPTSILSRAFHKWVNSYKSYKTLAAFEDFDLWNCTSETCSQRLSYTWNRWMSSILSEITYQTVLNP